MPRVKRALHNLQASGRCAMQIFQSHAGNPRPVRPGDLVSVRRARWRLVRVRAYDDCQVFTLCGLTAPLLGLERRFIVPFDRIESIARSARARVVRRVTWRRACRALIANDGTPGSVRVARSARIDLLPHQLEPALAILRGLGTRVLLADEVGLGKTIQAGLIAFELLSRGVIERVLVLTPPGLRDQWLQELRDRFSIQAIGVDGHTLRQLATELPVGVNPWHTLTVAVTSIDYVKRQEVLPAAASSQWDLVVLDEAHACAGDSDRRHAANTLANRAPYVVLLSATPHSGDREAFEALCAMGAVDFTSDRSRPDESPATPPLLVFRRTAADAGLATSRRIHIVGVRPSADEARMHALLARYQEAIRDEKPVRNGAAWLALSVLHKRALSS
ncbi:MAG: DEAD/DEAH box helicase, partial [Vicinamibacterales bacterium]